MTKFSSPSVTRHMTEAKPAAVSVPSVPAAADNLSGRSLPEWIGKTDDEPVPPRVRARVFLRFDGVCQECGVKIRTKRWICDHRIAIINSGENRESNLGPIHEACDKTKTASDVAINPKTRPDWPLPSFDAQDWAAAFCKIANDHGFKDAKGEPIDEGWMISWFANALMRGYDQRSAKTGALDVRCERGCALKKIASTLRKTK